MLLQDIRGRGGDSVMADGSPVEKREEPATLIAVRNE
jgi:hypothetical protein